MNARALWGKFTGHDAAQWIVLIGWCGVVVVIAHLSWCVA